MGRAAKEGGDAADANADSDEPAWKIRQDNERAASRAKRAAKEGGDAADANADSDEPAWKIRQDNERAASRAKRAAKEGGDAVNKEADSDAPLTDDERNEKKLEVLEDRDSNMGGGDAPPHQDSFADPMENPTRKPSHVPGTDDLGSDDGTADTDTGEVKPCDNSNAEGNTAGSAEQDKERIEEEKEKNEPPADVDGYDGAGLAPTHEPTALKTVKPNMDSEGLSTSPTVTPTIATTDAEPA